MLTLSGVNVDAWHGGICASVQVCALHDSRGSKVGIVHLTFTLPSAVASLLPTLLVRTCCQLVAFFAEIKIRWLSHGPLAFCYSGCCQLSWPRVADSHF